MFPAFIAQVLCCTCYSRLTDLFWTNFDVTVAAKDNFWSVLCASWAQPPVSYGVSPIQLLETQQNRGTVSKRVKCSVATEPWLLIYVAVLNVFQVENGSSVPWESNFVRVCVDVSASLAVRNSTGLNRLTQTQVIHRAPRVGIRFLTLMAGRRLILYSYEKVAPALQRNTESYEDWQIPTKKY